MNVVEIDAATTVGTFSVAASFAASPGITALFGPSGSGKSVTLATIAGLLRPSSGGLSLRGERVADSDQRLHVPTQRRHLGMVFQHAALLPHRSPLDNVAVGLTQGTRKDRRRAAFGWLERVHAGHLATAATPTLSGGEQQRVALARALVGQPDLLLLDEPFTALDLATRVSLRELVRQLVDEKGITALLVTHDIDDVIALADDLVLYEPGRTIATHHLDRGRPGQIAGILGLS